MKKRMVGLIAAILAMVTVAYASPAQADAGVSISLPGFGLSVGSGGVGLNIGLPWVVAPAPVPPPVYAYPDDAYQPAAIDAAPEFVQPPELGFYVAVGVPYDLYFYNNSYWINRGNVWYNSAYYNGPWSQIYYSNVPYVFNRFPFERVRHYRDAYYGRYQRYGAWDGYTHFRPVHREEYRGGFGHDRRDYFRPQNPVPNYRNRPDFRQPNNTWQGNGNDYRAKRPTTRDRDYRNNRENTRTYQSGPKNAAIPAYYRTNNAVRRVGNSPSQIRPRSFAPAANSNTAYNHPYKGGQAQGNEYANTRQHSSDQWNKQNNYNNSRNRRGDFTRGWQGERR
ncbi:MAG: hypothetical protein WCA04_09725 [Geobacteraceae bacterium]